MKDDRTPTPEEVMTKVAELHDRVIAHFEGKAGELGLTLPQALLLRQLDSAIPMSEIAGKLHCDASNVTGIVDRLEARGLVERRTRQDDRRVKEIVATTQGERMRNRVSALLSEIPGLSQMPADELATLLHLLSVALGRLPEEE